MKKSTFIAVIVILGLLQATVLNYINVFNVKPDLLLISAVFASFFFVPAWALSFSLFAGIIKDILSVNPFGLNSLLFVSWSFLIVQLSRKITFDFKYVRLLLMFIVALFNNIIYGLVSLIFGNFISLGIFLRIIIIAPLYTTFVFSLPLKYAKELGFDEEQIR